MDVTHITEFRDPADSRFEIVERKGRGHPDTLADRLAETLSRAYSRFTLQEHGTILRHQFDKLSLMGGKCDVHFGGGSFRSPVRLLINGRVTQTFGSTRIFFRDLLISTAEEFLSTELKNFDFYTNCRVMLEVASHSTRGMISEKGGSSPTHFRFRPRALSDLPEHTRPMANDTAVGCAWAPFSPTEAVVLELERTLTADAARASHPWLGSDVKIMACRVGDTLNITISVPQVSSHVHSAADYFANKDLIFSMVQHVLSERGFRKTNVTLSPGDELTEELIYLRLTGSCIESGDEGQVNRGNRIGGVTSSRRPFSIEGLSGKNPAYHAGKLYSVMAWDIANEIWVEQKLPCEVYIVSQLDRPLEDPWSVVVNGPPKLDRVAAGRVAEGIITNVTTATARLLDGKYPLV
jgi:S-adenosylmethionine synthetase